MTKRNIFDLILPFYWGIQGTCLLVYQSTGIITISVILLLISLLKMFIKSNNYNIIFLVVCSLYSICVCIAMFLLYAFFRVPTLWLLFTIVNFIVVGYMLRLYGRR